jgi:hypothetical protein
MKFLGHCCVLYLSILYFFLSIGVSVTLGASGETCYDPIVIGSESLPFVDMGDTCGFNNDISYDLGGSSSSGGDVVYAFTPQQYTRADISLCNSDLAFDTMLFVFTGGAGNCGVSPAYAANDNADCGGSPSIQSRVYDLTLFADTPYFIVVDGANATCGSYWLEITALKYSGGDGSSGNPYQIADVKDLLQLRNTPADYDAYFELTQDIDLTGHSFTTAIIAPDTDKSGTDFEGTPFTGHFDGNGHTITGLTITGGVKDYIGLFGQIGEVGIPEKPGVVENLHIVGGTIRGDWEVGSLAGRIRGSGSSVSNCSANVKVTGTDFVGGLVGSIDSGSVSNCSASGKVTGFGIAGGLMGWNGSSVSNCFASGDVTGVDGTGGLAGVNVGSFSNCYASGDVTAVDFAGGLTGYSSGSVSNCYASGSVTGTDEYAFVSGLVAYNEYGSVSNCYACGAVMGNGVYAYVGGLVAYDHSGTISGCFWDTDECDASNGVGNDPADPGAAGMATTEMMQESTFTGWDFTTVWKMLRPDEDYLRLAWQEEFVGDIAGLYGVDMADFAEIERNWLEEDCDTNDCEDADIDTSGDVGLADLLAVVESWLAGQ